MSETRRALTNRSQCRGAIVFPLRGSALLARRG
jgi:hypothetical protein